MQEKKWKVYKHKAPNEKIYIGITSQDPERRWQNGYGYATQQLFWRAIQKYGWENIQHEILEENLTKEVIDRAVGSDGNETGEELYFRRAEYMESILKAEFSDMEETLREKLIDERYSELYENNDH